MKEHGKPFSETKIRNWCFQIFQALDYMHKNGYFHRDLKPGDFLGYSCEFLSCYMIRSNFQKQMVVCRQKICS